MGSLLKLSLDLHQAGYEKWRLLFPDMGGRSPRRRISDEVEPIKLREPASPFMSPLDLATRERAARLVTK